MKAVVALSLLSAVQAAFTETVNGVTYTVTHLDADGSELPVEFGPDLSSISREPQRATRRSGKSVKRDQTFNNWCGASNIDPPGGAFNEVEGSWTVPNISLRQGQTDYDQPSLVQWVGIDGDGCNSGLIQGGSGSQINSNGYQTNFAWFEFVPAPLRTFQMNVRTGDEIYGLVTATSAKSGNVTVTNKSTGQSMNYYFSNGPGSLCGQSAEWILEDLTGLPSGNLDPFANFEDNYFSGCSATTTSGQRTGPGSNHNVNLGQNGRILCEGRVSGGNVYIHSD